MLSIQDSRVSFKEGKWASACVCGKVSLFATKSGALNMLQRETCRHCKKDYRLAPNTSLSIYKRTDGKWCSTCSGCSKEQAYTRMAHAKQSELRDWQCKTCSAQAKGCEDNKPVGDKWRLFNKFKKSAESRGIVWQLSVDDMFANFNGECALSGWPISINFTEQTASLDRIDSFKGYTVDNIQWTHTMVNMSKNKYAQFKFIEMCKAVADKVKW